MTGDPHPAASGAAPPAVPGAVPAAARATPSGWPSRRNRAGQGASDPAAVETLQERLVRLREAGRAIVLTTHDLDRAAPIATRTAILHRGRIASVLDGRGADDVAAAYRAVVAGGR